MGAARGAAFDAPQRAAPPRATAALRHHTKTCRKMATLPEERAAGSGGIHKNEEKKRRNIQQA